MASIFSRCFVNHEAIVGNDFVCAKYKIGLGGIFNQNDLCHKHIEKIVKTKKIKRTNFWVQSFILSIRIFEK